MFLQLSTTNTIQWCFDRESSGYWRPRPLPRSHSLRFPGPFRLGGWCIFGCQRAKKPKDELDEWIHTRQVHSHPMSLQFHSYTETVNKTSRPSLNQKVGMVHWADSHAYEFIHPLCHAHLGKRETSAGDICSYYTVWIKLKEFKDGKKKLRAAKTRSRWPFFSIQKLQESLQKQVRSPGLSILCVVLQRNLIQVQQLTQSLWSLRSWPLHCPGVHTSAPGRPNEMQHSESPMKAKTQDFDQTQLAGITTQKSAKCWYHKFTETQAQPCKATDLDASWLGAWWEEKVRSVRWPLRVPIKTRPLCNLPVSKTIC